MAFVATNGPVDEPAATGIFTLLKMHARMARANICPMPAVTVQQMREAEYRAMDSGLSEEKTLNDAGSNLGHAIARFFPKPGHAIAYLGKGHNAGDALVALRILRDTYGSKISSRLSHPIDACAPLTRKKWNELGIAENLSVMPDWQICDRPLILIDGLLGIGAQGPMREPLLTMAREMRWLRENAGARIAAVDIPSGIDADSGTATPDTVTADLTLMIGLAKRGLLMSHAANHTGALSLVSVDCLKHSHPTDIELICPQNLHFGKSPRSFDFHKGMAGRVAILAGSTNYPGAAVLAAIGALRGGAGLITLHTPKDAAPLIAPRCPPEIIIHPYSSPLEVLETRFDSIVIGCGIGHPDQQTQAEIIRLIAETRVPTVIDADALNLIAANLKTHILDERHLITPHPLEFARLFPDLTKNSREAAVSSFIESSKATLLLKGSLSLIAQRGNPILANSTGTPAMATGGQGDLLSGVIGAQIAAGLTPIEAAALGAWLCGRASEIAIHSHSQSEQSLSPSDTANHLGQAFIDWHGSQR
jgi:NAD(P)H-hydrate epimerase